jgi:hypothetical protein
MWIASAATGDRSKSVENIKEIKSEDSRRPELEGEAAVRRKGCPAGFAARRPGVATP